MSITILPRFLHSQLLYKPPYPTTDCTGKTIIVTGGNVGLGKEAARHFVRLNAEKVIITSRSAEKGEAAKRDIEATTKRSGVLEVWPLDLQDYDSVKGLAKRAQGLLRLDIVVENAGMLTEKFRLAGGNETTITVNVVSTFLLALLILPKLQETARKYSVTPTLTIVSSEVHFFTIFPERKASSIFGTLNDPKEARMKDRYFVSKMLEVLACREIAGQHPIDEMKVILNFVNPGWCHSELVREVSSAPIRMAMAIMARSTEEGSRCLVCAGLAGSETHGQYISDCKVRRCAPLVEGKEGPDMQRKVWAELTAKLEEIEPGVTRALERQT